MSEQSQVPDFIDPDMDATYGPAPHEPAWSHPSPGRNDSQPSNNYPHQRSDQTRSKHPPRWFTPQPGEKSSTLISQLADHHIPVTYGVIAAMIVTMIAQQIIPALTPFLGISASYGLHQPWSFFTASIAQYPHDYLGVLISALMLYVTGRTLEPALSSPIYAQLLALSALWGNVCYCVVGSVFLLDPRYYWSLMVGSSALIAGVLGAFFIITWKVQHADLKAFYVMAGLLALTFLLNPHQGWQSYLGGAAAGMATVYTVIVCGNDPRKKGRRQLIFAAFFLVPFLLMVLLTQWRGW